MLKIVRVTKITRLIRLSEILADIKSDTTDEKIAEKYRLTWSQMARAYSKLFHEGFLAVEDLRRRLAMRSGKAASHIPLVQMDDSAARYECFFCGFVSPFHFSACPRCQALNLRRLWARVDSAADARGGENFVYAP